MRFQCPMMGQQHTHILFFKLVFIISIKVLTFKSMFLNTDPPLYMSKHNINEP
jgi:hypothetical protein